MLVYANQTADVADGFPPFATIVSDAMAVHWVMAFCASDSLEARTTALKIAGPNQRTLMSRLLPCRAAADKWAERDEVAAGHQCTQPPRDPIRLSFSNSFFIKGL